MVLMLVRHAKAGDRSRWGGPGGDQGRPLSGKGQIQAKELAGLLVDEAAAAPPVRVLSSPAVRCIQTVEPLAAALGLEVEISADLMEGSVGAAVRLVRSLVGVDAVVCSHGDVIPLVLERMAEADGLALPEPRPSAKAATWILDSADGRVVSARYLPPPR